MNECPVCGEESLRPEESAFCSRVCEDAAYPVMEKRLSIAMAAMTQVELQVLWDAVAAIVGVN